MSRLNIPLGRTSATRPARRVAWFLGLIACLAAAYAGTTAWFERTDVGSAVPEGTVAILRLHPGANGWERVLDAVGHLTAVSDRGLTLRELAPYANGDLAVFFDADGRRSAAIRSETLAVPEGLLFWQTPTEETPADEDNYEPPSLEDLLDTHGITATSASSGLVVLTDRSRPLTAVRLPQPWVRRAWGLFFPRVGTAYVQWEGKPDGSWKTGVVTADADGWAIRLPRLPLPASPWKRFPAGTVLHMSTPVWPNNGLEEQEASLGASAHIDTLLRQIHAPAVANTFSTLLLAREPDETESEGFGYVLSTENDGLSPEDRLRLLTASAAFYAPTLRPWTLPDQTQADEIVADPASVTVEERLLAGGRVRHVRSPNGHVAVLAEKDQSFALTNRERLAFAWLGIEEEPDGEPTKASVCFQGAAYASMRDLFAASSATFHQPNVLRDLSLTFSEGSLKNSPFSTTIRLCY